MPRRPAELNYVQVTLTVEYLNHLTKDMPPSADPLYDQWVDVEVMVHW